MSVRPPCSSLLIVQICCPITVSPQGGWRLGHVFGCFVRITRVGSSVTIHGPNYFRADFHRLSSLLWNTSQYPQLPWSWLGTITPYIGVAHNVSPAFFSFRVTPGSRCGGACLVFAKWYCENVATDIGVGSRDACSQCGQFNRRSRTFCSLSGTDCVAHQRPPVASPNASHAPLEPAWFLHERGVGVHQWKFVMSHGRVYRTIPPHQHLVL